MRQSREALEIGLGLPGSRSTLHVDGSPAACGMGQHEQHLCHCHPGVTGVLMGWGQVGGWQGCSSEQKVQ